MYVFGLTFMNSLKYLMSNQTWICASEALKGEDLVHKCKLPVSGCVHSHSKAQIPPCSTHQSSHCSWAIEYKCHHFIILTLWDIWVKYCCNFMNSWVMSKSVLYQVPMTFDLWPLIIYHFTFKSEWTVCQTKTFPSGIFEKLHSQEWDGQMDNPQT